MFEFATVDFVIGIDLLPTTQTQQEIPVAMPLWLRNKNGMVYPWGLLFDLSM